MATKDLVFTILGIDKASDKFDKVGKSIDRMANIGTAALGGFTAASVASAAAVAAAVGGIPLAFIGLGAVALRENAAVKQSFADLAHEVRTGLAADAAPLADAYVGAAADMGAAYDRLRPQMARAFAGSVPHVETLTAGVIGFAENAMPGMVTSVERAEPVMEGFESLLKDAGTGLGDFLGVVSEHSDEAGQGVEHLGALVRGVLPEVGGMIGDLTGLWADHGDEVVDVVTRIVGILGDLSGNALPVVSVGLGVVLGMLNSVLGVLEPITPILGPMIGAWISLAAAMKGMAAANAVVTAFSGSVTAFGKSMGKAENRARSFRLAGAAVALGLGAVLTSINQLNPQVDAMESGLSDWVDTGQATGEAARVLGSDLGDLDYAIQGLADTGLTRGTAEVAEFFGGLVGLKGPLAEAKEQVGALDSSLAGMVSSGNGERAAEIVAQIAEKTGESIQAVKDQLPEYAAAMEMAAERTEALGTSSMQSMPGIDALEEALATLEDQTADTADKADALNDAWRRLFGIQIGLQEATANWEEGLDSIRETIQGAKEDSANWRTELFNANGSINSTTEAGRGLLENLIAQGEEYRTLAQTSYDTAIAQGQSQQQATAAAAAAVNQRRAQFIREQVALGLTRQRAEALANEYLGFPGDVRTLIHTPGMATAIANMRTYLHRTNAIPRHISTTVTTIFTSIGTGPTAANRALSSTYADGGIRRFANGSEDHRAQIARPGDWRLWAEPETGGEAYIPLGRNKRAGSVPILNEVADMFGYQLVPETAQRFLNGGMLTAAREMLNRISGGGQFFEDFSFRGASGNVGRYNDQIADMFYGSRPGFDFGQRGTRAAIVQFLRKQVAPPQQPKQEPVRISIDPSGLDDALLKWLRNSIRVRGGNVQVVLGKGKG